MGLIAAIKLFLRAQFAEPRVADLVRQDRALLERAIAGVPYELLDEREYQCRVVTEHYTLSFTWDWRDRWIESHVYIHDSRDHPLDPWTDHSARAWLEAVGLPTLPLRAGSRTPALLRDELETVRQVVSEILSDDRKVKEALWYLEGRLCGYNDRYRVPEEAPPKFVTDWTEDRLRLRARS